MPPGTPQRLIEASFSGRCLLMRAQDGAIEHQVTVAILRQRWKGRLAAAETVNSTIGLTNTFGACLEGLLSGLWRLEEASQDACARRA
jgi:hypothetical protein